MKLLLSLVLTLQTFALESRPTEFDKFFQQGDTVAFLGDSITHGGDYHALIQAFLSTRYPEMDLWTENVGRSGDTSWGTLRDRLEGDLYAAEPDSVIIHFGMNDVGRDTFKDMKEAPSDESRKKRRSQYQQAMTKLVDTLLKRDLRLAILSPTLFDDSLNRWDNQNQSPHLNAELAKFGEIGLTLATEKSLPFIDVHTPLTRITEEQQAKKDSFSFTADRVHPKNGGYPVMAWKILKDLGTDPIVFMVSVSPDGTIRKQDHAKITGLKKDGTALQWTSEETRLPFPVKEKGHDTAFALIPFQEDLNRMMLQVTDLSPGKYALKIDDKEVGEFDAEALAAGINLAPNPATPQYAEAMALRDGLITEKLNLQATLRNLNSFRLDLMSQAKTYPAILEADWKNPDAPAILAIRERQIAEKKSKKQNTGSYFGFISSEAKKHLAETPKIRARLTAIRKELNSLPTSRTHTYRVEPR